jgi:hypothetical protein
MKIIGKVSQEVFRRQAESRLPMDSKKRATDCLDMASMDSTIRAILAGEKISYTSGLRKIPAEWTLLTEYEMARTVEGKPINLVNDEIARW